MSSPSGSRAEEDADLKNRSVRGAAWYGGSRFAIQLLTWATTIVVARLVAPSDFGLLGMALIYVSFVDLVNELGLGAAVVQRRDLADVDLDSVFWFGILISAGLYGLTLVLAPAVASFFNEPALSRLLWLMGLALVFSGLRTVPWALLTRAVDFKSRSQIEVIARGSGAVTTLALAYAGLGVWALAVGTLLPGVVMTVGAHVVVGWRPRARLKLESLKETLGFSLGVAGGRMAWFLYESSDKFIVAKVLGGPALGLYGLASRITLELPDRLVAIVNQVAFPVYSRLQDSPGRLQRYYLTAVSLVSSVVLPASVGMCLVAQDLIPLLLTDKWAAAARPAQILAIGGLVKALHALAGPVVIAKGRSAEALRFNLLCLAVLPGCYLLASRTGIEGVSLVWVTVYPVLVAGWLVWTRRLIGYEWGALMKGTGPPLLSTAVMALAVLTTRTQLVAATAVVRVAVSILVGILVYGGALLLLAPIRPRTLWKELRQATLGPGASAA